MNLNHGIFIKINSEVLNDICRDTEIQTKIKEQKKYIVFLKYRLETPEKKT